MQRTLKERPAPVSQELAEALTQLKPKHARWVQCVLKGESDTSAYRKVYRCSRAAAESNSWRLRENDGVKQVLAIACSETAAQIGLSLAQKRHFLRLVIETPLEDVGPDSILCQEAVFEEIGGTRGRLRRGDADEGNEVTEPVGRRVKIKMPDKLRALELDAKLAGELRETVDHTIRPYVAPEQQAREIDAVVVEMHGRSADVAAARLALASRGASQDSAEQ